MPLSKDVLEQYKNNVFVETGTYHGESVALALQLGFSAIHTIEVDNDLFTSVRLKYQNDKRVRAYLGDSADNLEHIVRNLASSATIWLDAHPLVTPMPLFDPQFPLLRELIVLRRFLPSNNHVILIDDMRTFSDYERSILEFAMRQMWPNAKFKYHPDYISNIDIYCCELPA